MNIHWVEPENSKGFRQHDKWRDFTPQTVSSVRGRDRLVSHKAIGCNPLREKKWKCLSFSHRFGFTNRIKDGTDEKENNQYWDETLPCFPSSMRALGGLGIQRAELWLTHEDLRWFPPDTHNHTLTHVWSITKAFVTRCTHIQRHTQTSSARANGFTAPQLGADHSLRGV